MFFAIRCFKETIKLRARVNTNRFLIYLNRKSFCKMSYSDLRLARFNFKRLPYGRYRYIMEQAYISAFLKKYSDQKEYLEIPAFEEGSNEKKSR
jgi:hypothetical protein